MVKEFTDTNWAVADLDACISEQYDPTSSIYKQILRFPLQIIAFPY